MRWIAGKAIIPYKIIVPKWHLFKSFKDNVKKWNLIIEQYDYDDKTWNRSPQNTNLQTHRGGKDDASYYFSYFLFYFSV